MVIIVVFRSKMILKILYTYINFAFICLLLNLKKRILRFLVSFFSFCPFRTVSTEWVVNDVTILISIINQRETICRSFTENWFQLTVTIYVESPVITFELGHKFIRNYITALPWRRCIVSDIYIFPQFAIIKHILL